MGTPTFVRAVEAQLANINRDLAELKGRVSRAGAAAKQKAMATLQGLPEKRDELAQRLASLKDTLAEASEGVRSELVEACRELRKAVEKALEMTPVPRDADAEENEAERSEGAYEIYDTESPTFEPRKSEPRKSKESKESSKESNDSADGIRPRPEVRRWQ